MRFGHDFAKVKTARFGVKRGTQGNMIVFDCGDYFHCSISDLIFLLQNDPHFRRLR